MMNQTRWRTVGSIAGGVFVALVLFLFMNTLITVVGSGQQGAATAGQIVDLIRVQEERNRADQAARSAQEAATAQRILRRRPNSRFPTRPSRRRTRCGSIFPRSTFPGAAGGGPFIGTWEPGDPAAEGEAIPIVRIDPTVPARGSDGRH